MTIDPDSIFGRTEATIDDIQRTIDENISLMTGFAQDAYQSATEVINALQAEAPYGMGGEEAFLIPAPPTINEKGMWTDALDPIDLSTAITAPDTPDPTLGGVYTPSIGNVPEFSSSIGGITIPPRPGDPDISGKPSRPAIDMMVALPSSPNPAEPGMDTLLPVTVPEFSYPTLPTFDATAPEFEGTPIGSVFAWDEPTYHREILDDVLAQVRKYFAGGTGIPAAVERAIMERGVDRDLILVDRAVSEAYDEFSARGFTAPPGSLASRVDAIRQEALLKAQGTNREVIIKAAEWEIENIRFAVQQGIACENLLINMFLNMAQRMFEAARYRIESEIAVYNAQIAIFNARQQAYATESQVFKIKIDAELAKIEVFKAEIEGMKAEASLNEQKVRVYVAQLDGVQKQIDIYRARMEGARVQSEIIKSQIDAYKADIEAYAAKIGAEKIRFDAYETQVKAEAAKAGIIDAEARAFAATIEGFKTGADVEIAKSRNSIELNKLTIEQFIASLEKDKALIQAQLGTVQAQAAKQQALTAAYVANAETVKASAQLGVSVQEANTRNFLAYYEMQVAKYNQAMQRMIQRAQVIVDGLKSAGQISSSLASGAMAALHMGTSLSGSAAEGASFTGSISETTNTSL